LVAHVRYKYSHSESSSFLLHLLIKIVYYTVILQHILSNTINNCQLPTTTTANNRQQPPTTTMDWVRAALRSNKKDNKGVHQVSIEELQEAIDATGAELARVREMGAQTRQRRANEMLQLKRDRQVRDHDLIALASVAKRFTSLWEYARIVRTSFAEDQLGHTWFGWCEAWLLRLIHHAMMFKNQFTIVQKDCNGMLMDLYETIPKIKEEQNLGEAVALNNLCKQEISSRQSKQDHQEYVRLQRKIICKLKMRTAENPP
jgi:membrane-associated HD superfamily phosphohydrolase